MKFQNTVMEIFLWLSKHLATKKNGKNQAKMGLLPTMRLIHPQARNAHLSKMNVCGQVEAKNSSSSGKNFSLRVIEGAERMHELFRNKLSRKKDLH